MKGRWVIRRFRKKFKGAGKKEDKHRVNHNILAPEVRVIDNEGSMLGVMNVQEGITLAQEKGMDLVEIAAKATPPTCKIMDYGKWKFEIKKKEKLAKKNQTKIVIKEVQLRPRTDQYDFDIKIKKAREFLLNGHKVKLHLRFLGRELAHKDIGLEMIDRVTEKLKDLALDDVEKSHSERRSVLTLFSPDPAKIKEYKRKNSPPSKPPA